MLLAPTFPRPKPVVSAAELDCLSLKTIVSASKTVVSASEPICLHPEPIVSGLEMICSGPALIDSDRAPTSSGPDSISSGSETSYPRSELHSSALKPIDSGPGLASAGVNALACAMKWFADGLIFLPRMTDMTRNIFDCWAGLRDRRGGIHGR